VVGVRIPGENLEMVVLRIQIRRQEITESSGVVKGKSTVISIIFLPFKILMSFFWFFAYLFTLLRGQLIPGEDLRETLLVREWHY
ncbi:hypothetical protein N8653_06455, partial [Euryarchaeota archaeon]|nr:hypothetical protein [Euryarchaeota archaeon]